MPTPTTRRSSPGAVEEAISTAKEIAGGNFVTIASANVIQQALNLGLVDEICVSLLPVLFGAGIRYFGNLVDGHVLLNYPIVVQGQRALHFRYTVQR
jgi:dihydrofolate reductase